MTTWGYPPEPRAEERETRTYVTEVWCPPFDHGVVRLHSQMKGLEPEPELQAES
jgi:hypothetical protein